MTHHSLMKAVIQIIKCKIGRHEWVAATRAVRKGWDEVEQFGVDNDVTVHCRQCGVKR